MNIWKVIGATLIIGCIAALLYVTIRDSLAGNPVATIALWTECLVVGALLYINNDNRKKR